MSHIEYKIYEKSCKSWEDLWLSTCATLFHQHLLLEHSLYEGGVFLCPDIWFKIIKRMIYSHFLPSQTRGGLIMQFNQKAAESCKQKFNDISDETHKDWVKYLILHYETTVLKNLKRNLKEATDKNDVKGIEYTEMFINAAEDFADQLKAPPSSSAQICAKCNLPIINSD